MNQAPYDSVRDLGTQESAAAAAQGPKQRKQDLYYLTSLEH